MSTVEAKRLLRKAVLSKRASMAPSEVEENSAVIFEAVARTDVFKLSEAISCYMALRTEVQTVPLIELALADGKRVAVPRVSSERGGLELYWITSSSQGFLPGPYGILEPLPERAMEAAPTEIELFLVPGLAFDDEGWRIGFGKGYYDRLLSRASPEARRAGLAFQFQVLPRCPRGPFDVPMHHVFTEEKVIVCTQRT